MAIVQKLNKQLTVNDSDVDNYLKAGYDLLDERGVVKTVGAKSEVSYSEYKSQIEKKDAEITRLKTLLGKQNKD